MHRAFIYGPRMCGMTHAGQFEPSPRTPPPPYPAAPYANLRTPGGSGHFPPRAAFLSVTVAIENHTCLPASNHSGRVRIVILRGVFAPLPRPLGLSLSTLRAIRNLTQLPQNNRDHQILIDTSFGVLAPAPANANGVTPVRVNRRASRRRFCRGGELSSPHPARRRRRRAPVPLVCRGTLPPRRANRVRS